MNAKKKNYPVKVGEVRPSQLLHTYGVGSIVELPRISVMVMGLQDWDSIQTGAHRGVSPAEPGEKTSWGECKEALRCPRSSPKTTIPVLLLIN